MDIVDKQTRTQMMSGIRSKNTRPERVVRSFLHRRGFRFRLYSRKLPGKPDLVLSKYRLAVFVHGCFWHRHPNCSKTSTPATNTKEWLKKFSVNQERDSRSISQLLSAGCRVFVLWECGLRDVDSRSLDWLPNAIASLDTVFFEWPLGTKDQADHGFVSYFA
jgi:DNA mismatch endonuclease (patch repair protein)